MRYSTDTTGRPVRPAIGTGSVSEPESTWKPPPCRLSSTGPLPIAETPAGYTIRTGTPAIVVFSTRTL